MAALTPAAAARARRRVGGAAANALSAAALHGERTPKPTRSSTKGRSRGSRGRVGARTFVLETLAKRPERAAEATAGCAERGFQTPWRSSRVFPPGVRQPVETPPRPKNCANPC